MRGDGSKKVIGLLSLERELQSGGHVKAAASLREGLHETLACQHLGLPPELVVALGTTNLIENAFATTESICHRVRRWRTAAQAKRWATMVLLKAESGFNAVAPPQTMAALAACLERHLGRRTMAVFQAI